ncbi:MAG: shikimate dehydrogenase [bacterium]
MINGRTKITGVFGYPVEHTLSPIIHNTAFEYLGLNYVYLPFLVKPEDIKSALAGIKALDICGVNLTIPHKEACIPYLDSIDSDAGVIGAVNTIKLEKGKLKGYNTDAEGFILSLKNETSFTKPKGKTVFILGAGGSSRAVVYALAKEKAARIIVANRNIGRAKKLIHEINKKFPLCKMEAIALGEKFVEEYLRESNLLVNTTSVGLKYGDGILINTNFLHKDLLFYDLVYSPFGTKLLIEAKKRKLEAIDGLGMLIYQAILAFGIWTGKKPPVKIIQQAVRNFIRQTSSPRRRGTRNKNTGFPPSRE